MSAFKSVTIGLPVTDLEKATSWYRQLFGQCEEITPMPGMLEMQLMPSVWLQLFESDSKEISAKSINIEVNDITQQHSYVQSLGIDVGDIEFVEGVVQFFTLSDPFGNRLAFVKVLS